MNIGPHITSSVPSLKGFLEESSIVKNGIAVLKALASVMEIMNRYDLQKIFLFVYTKYC